MARAGEGKCRRAARARGRVCAVAVAHGRGSEPRHRTCHRGVDPRGTTHRHRKGGHRRSSPRGSGARAATHAPERRSAASAGQGALIRSISKNATMGNSPLLRVGSYMYFRLVWQSTNRLVADVGLAGRLPACLPWRLVPRIGGSNTRASLPGLSLVQGTAVGHSERRGRAAETGLSQ